MILKQDTSHEAQGPSLVGYNSVNLLSYFVRDEINFEISKNFYVVPVNNRIYNHVSIPVYYSD